MKPRTVVLLVVAVALAGLCFDAPCPAQATRPASDPVMAEARKTFFELYPLWKAGRHEECKRFFGKDAIGQGRVSLAEAVAARGDIGRRKVHFDHVFEPVATDGVISVKVRTHWLLPAEEADGQPRLLVTDETFIRLAHAGRSYVDTYKVEDVTEPVVAKALSVIERFKRGYEDPKTPERERLQLGARLYTSYWENGRFESMWPLLKDLVDRGIKEKHPPAWGLVEEMTQKAAREVETLEAYADLVKTVSGAGAAQTRPSR